MAQLVVMLPAFNEERALPHLLDQIELLRERLAPAWQVEALVVDDGSNDQTAFEAMQRHGALRCRLLSHDRNQGLGAALKSGILWFCEHSSDKAALAVLDADGTHPPALLERMLGQMYSEGGDTQYDIVIASRYAEGGMEHGLSRRRRFYSRTASYVLSALAPIPAVRDYTCGYRLYDGALLHRALEQFGQNIVTERSFVCMAELLIRLAQLGARCSEVGLDLHYELKQGPSKLNVPVTIWRYSLLGWRLLFARRP